MRENTYVRVFAHVRAFGGKRNLAAFRLYQLVDMNELTTHLLEVIHCHLKTTKATAVSFPAEADILKKSILIIRRLKTGVSHESAILGLRLILSFKWPHTSRDVSVQGFP